LGWERKRVAIVEGNVIVQISQEYAVEQQKTEERERKMKLVERSR
jgi:hypothetical protein